MRNSIRSVVLLMAAAIAVVAAPAQAQGHYGGYHGGYHGAYHGGYYRGGGWGGLGLGIGLGIGLGALAYDSYYYPPYVYPGYVVLQNPPPVTYAAPAQAAPASPPDPVIYPRSGQSAAQTEADRQACNRWATTVPAAMADASVFQRAVEACMDGRGYTVK